MIVFSDSEGNSGGARRTAFKYYLSALSLIFIIFFFFDLFIDLITPLWLSAIIPLFFIVPLILLQYGVKASYLLTLNIIGLLSVFQLLLYLNPKNYYILIYWIGLIPLLVISLVKPKAAKIWGIVFLLFMVINGAYISINFPSYETTLYPKKYLTAGFVFWMITFSIVFIINYIQEKNKALLTSSNNELSGLKQQIEKKNEELNTQNQKINRINEELRKLNDHLESRIAERTSDLEQRNSQLTEYAFINSHLLRAPVARVIGLLNLIDKTEGIEKREEILKHLNQAGVDLEKIVSKISNALEDEFSTEK